MTHHNAPLQNEFAPRSILIVEDSEDDLMAVTRHIKKAWPETKVLSATTLEKAFSYCQSNFFDLVLLDLNLPDSRGAETVHEFRKFNLGARVVAMTGMDVNFVGKDVKRHGATACISKAKLMDDDFVDLLLEEVFQIPPLAWGS